MKDFIDTNLLLRYLTGEPTDQFERARALMPAGPPLEGPEMLQDLRDLARNFREQ